MPQDRTAVLGQPATVLLPVLPGVVQVPAMISFAWYGGHYDMKRRVDYFRLGCVCSHCARVRERFPTAVAEIRRLLQVPA